MSTRIPQNSAPDALSVTQIRHTNHNRTWHIPIVIPIEKLTEIAPDWLPKYHYQLLNACQALRRFLADKAVIAVNLLLNPNSCSIGPRIRPKPCAISRSSRYPEACCVSTLIVQHDSVGGQGLSTKTAKTPNMPLVFALSYLCQHIRSNFEYCPSLPCPYDQFPDSPKHIS